MVPILHLSLIHPLCHMIFSTEVAESVLLTLDFELGHGICFGQWNASQCDT